MSENENVGENAERQDRILAGNAPLPEVDEPMINQVSGIGTVLYCLERDEQLIAGLMVNEPRSRYPIHHPMLVESWLDVGQRIAIHGRIAQEECWRPARQQGQVIVHEGRAVGARMLTAFIDVMQIHEVPEHFEDFMLGRIECKLVGQPIPVVSRRNQRKAQFNGRRPSPQYLQEMPTQFGQSGDRLIWDAVSDLGLKCKFELFANDRANTNRVDYQSRVVVDYGPSWTRGDVSVQAVEGETPITMPVLNAAGQRTEEPVLVHDDMLRIVISSRLVDTQQGIASEPLQAESAVDEQINQQVNRVRGL